MTFIESLKKSVKRVLKETRGVRKGWHRCDDATSDWYYMHCYPAINGLYADWVVGENGHVMKFCFPDKNLESDPVIGKPITVEIDGKKVDTYEYQPEGMYSIWETEIDFDWMGR